MKPARLAILAALLVPADALAAPTLAPLKPCYVSAGVDPATGETLSEEVALNGSGFTPGAAVDLLVDGTTAGRVTADAAGAFAATVRSPLQERGEREFIVTATDPSQPAAGASSRITALRVAVSPLRARPTQRVTFRGRGFTRSTPIYAHYTRRGKARRTVRLADAPKGPCGTFRTRRRQFPIRRPQSGLWTLRVDQEPRFRARPRTAFVDLEVFVKRVLRFRD